MKKIMVSLIMSTLAACSVSQESDIIEQSPLNSCDGLPATCGVNGNESCCSKPMVPGGTFLRAYDASGDDKSGTPDFPATITAFRLDKFEVTVGRFRQFVDAHKGLRRTAPAHNAGSHAHILGSGWQYTWNTFLVNNSTQLTDGLKTINQIIHVQTWTDISDRNELKPINNVTWYEAMAFCIWEGGYLPTEAERNYAAVGGDEQRALPWAVSGSAITPANASFFCNGDGNTNGCSIDDLLNVGSLPNGAGKWGHLDLSGNVVEWTLDNHGDLPVPCNDCANLQSDEFRAVRGGSYSEGSQTLRAAYRLGDYSPMARTQALGFRCAYPVD